MDVEASAVGGPALRRAWEAEQLRPADLAAGLGVSRAALYKWAAAGGHTPAAQVDQVAEQLRRHQKRRARAADELLEVITAAAAGGRGLTLTELRKSRRAGDTDQLIEQLLRGALPLAHSRDVVARDEQGRTYVRQELHPGAEPVANVPAENELDPATLRGLRLYAGHSLDGMARRYGCRRQQLQAWEAGREQIPAGRLPVVRHALTQAVGRVELRERREQVEMSQAELARRAGLRKPVLSRAETGNGRALHESELVAIGHVLDQAERAAATELAAAVDALIELVAGAEPNGLTESNLERARSRGRVGGQTGAAARDAKVLVVAEAARRVEWVEHHDAQGRGGRLMARRLHLAGYAAAAAGELSAEELRHRLAKAGVSASELARELGVSWGTVARWARGERRVTPPRVPHVLAVLEQLASRPRVAPAQRLLEAVAGEPGLPRWQLLEHAGYGKNNTRARAALQQLIDTDQVHLQPRPHHSSVVLPGPANNVAARMAGSQLREMRLTAGFRQRDLAAAAGVSQTAVAGWERTGLPADRRPLVEPLLLTSA